MTVASVDETIHQLLVRLDTPYSQPILVQDDQRAGVLMSTAEYQRMRAIEFADFQKFREDLSTKVQARGLTEEKLAEILAEIDAETPR